MNKYYLGEEEFGEASWYSFLFGATRFFDGRSTGLQRERPRRDLSLLLWRVWVNQGCTFPRGPPDI